MALLQMDSFDPSESAILTVKPGPKRVCYFNGEASHRFDSQTDTAATTSKSDIALHHR